MTSPFGPLHLLSSRTVFLWLVMNFIKVDLPAPGFPRIQNVPSPDLSQLRKLALPSAERSSCRAITGSSSEKTHLNVDLCASGILSWRSDRVSKLRLLRTCCCLSIVSRLWSDKVRSDRRCSRHVTSVGYLPLNLSCFFEPETLLLELAGSPSTRFTVV